MQSLVLTTSSNSVVRCASELLDTAPILIRYIRIHMRRHRQSLSVPQFRALYKVRTQPAASISAVAEHLGASLPTASRLVDTLVAKGYLSRCACARDRRQVALHLTPHGRTILDAAHTATHSQMESRLSTLRVKDCDVICHAMRILQSLLNSDDIPRSDPSTSGFAAAPKHSRPRRIRSKTVPSSVALNSANVG